MTHIKTIFLLIAIAMLAGCVGTDLQEKQSYTANQSDSFSYEIIETDNVSAEGMSIFKNRLDSKLSALGLSDQNPNKTVEITFKNYYMRHGAARALVGIMAGADNITTEVTIKDKSTGAVLGSFQVVSKNPTATGTARGLIEQHADKIANYIKSGEV